MSDAVRCFFALLPPPTHLDALTHAQDSLGAEPWASAVRWTPAASLHLTLRFLGEVPESALASLRQLADACAARAPRLDLSLDRVTGFPSPSRARVVVALLRADRGLLALADDLEQAVTDAGHAPERRRFRPHYTLGRVRRPPLRARVAAALPAQWAAPGALHLVRSHLDPGGARYESLHAAALD